MGSTSNVIATKALACKLAMGRVSYVSPIWRIRRIKPGSGEEGLAGRSIRGHAPAMESVTERLRNLLRYVAVKLIDDPSLRPAQPNAVERRPT